MAQSVGYTVQGAEIHRLENHAITCRPLSTSNPPCTPASLSRPAMNLLDCIKHLRAARKTGAWGEYLVQPSTENILLADVLAERGFDVRAVRWSYEVLDKDEHKRAVCLALQLPNGRVLEVRTGTRGALRIEKKHAKAAGVEWFRSWIDFAHRGRAMEEVVRQPGGHASLRATDEAYDRQRILVSRLLDEYALEQNTCPSPATRPSPRL